MTRVLHRKATESPNDRTSRVIEVRAKASARTVREYEARAVQPARHQPGGAVELVVHDLEKPEDRRDRNPQLRDEAQRVPRGLESR